MQIASEPPSCAFTGTPGRDCHPRFHTEDSPRPPSKLPASILIPSNSCERTQPSGGRKLMPARQEPFLVDGPLTHDKAPQQPPRQNARRAATCTPDAAAIDRCRREELPGADMTFGPTSCVGRIGTDLSPVSRGLY